MFFARDERGCVIIKDIDALGDVWFLLRVRYIIWVVNA